VFDSVLDVAADAVKSGKTVGLTGLGTLRIKVTAARQGVRPGTAEEVVHRAVPLLPSPGS